jgi:hypothetical protein
MYVSSAPRNNGSILCTIILNSSTICYFVHMQVTTSSVSSHSNNILVKGGWKSEKELFDQVDALNPEVFQTRKLDIKPVYIYKLKNLIAQVEVAGDFAQEAKKMVEPGSIFESMSSEYLEIRNEYLMKRKKLRNQLVEIKAMLTQG